MFDKDVKLKYGALWAGFNTEKTINKFFIIFFYLRKFLFALFLVFLQSNPYAQLGMIMSLNFLLLIGILGLKVGQNK